jgi:ABC-2 type transport system ATP-binding protein
MIRVQGFTKRYDDFTAVSELSFEVASGSILGLVGQNGAGKTTTLRTLAGILEPNHGTIEIAGHDLEKQPIAARREVAYVPDTPHPFDMLTVDEHLRFTALAYDVQDAAQRFPLLLEELELAEKHDHLASTLSRGMQQKLAIGCAFLRGPKALLLDEPLTGLDPRGIKLMRDAIKSRAALGASVIVSSHQLELVERLCDRILVLHRGKAIAQGNMEEIRIASGLGTAATLEEVFFALTDVGPGEPAPS